MLRREYLSSCSILQNDVHYLIMDNQCVKQNALYNNKDFKNWHGMLSHDLSMFVCHMALLW